MGLNHNGKNCLGIFLGKCGELKNNNARAYNTALNNGAKINIYNGNTNNLPPANNANSISAESGTQQDREGEG